VERESHEQSPSAYVCANPSLSPEIEKAVRMALVPRLADDADSDLAKFSTPADGFGGFGSLATNEAPVSVTTLKPSALEKIQEFLIRGERKQACHYALDEKLWAHAMVIARSTDRDAWQEVVKEFIRAELGPKEVRDDKPKPSDPRRGPLPTATSNGRESLRVAYSLFAGQGAASGIYIYLTSCGNSRLIFTPVQAMLPPAPLSRVVDNKLAPPPSTPLGVTPTSPHFAVNLPTNVPAEVLARWAETVAMMLSNPASPETPAALTALGDHLSANQWTEAAHTWYRFTLQIHLYYVLICALSATCCPHRHLSSVALGLLRPAWSSWGLLARPSPPRSARIQTP